VWVLVAWQQLKTANKCWEQHLKQVNKDNAARHAALESECKALRQQLADAGTLRRDCDEAVTSAKRLAEDAEVWVRVKVIGVGIRFRVEVKVGLGLGLGLRLGLGLGLG
jgi:hypothetical protein